MKQIPQHSTYTPANRTYWNGVEFAILLVQPIVDIIANERTIRWRHPNRYTSYINAQYSYVGDSIAIFTMHCDVGAAGVMTEIRMSHVIYQDHTLYR